MMGYGHPVGNPADTPNEATEVAGTGSTKGVDVTSSRLDILEPYEHLKGNIDHVVLSGTVADLRRQDIVLDGTYWVKTISEGKHDGEDAVTLQLAVLDMPGKSFGRLTLLKYAPLTFARPVEYETWDLHATDLVPDEEYGEAEAMLTSKLAPGDYVGWTEDQYDEDAKCRARRVVQTWPNGLIQFEDGVYQSEPNNSWYILNIDPADKAAV